MVAALVCGEALLRRGGLRSGYEGDHGIRTVLPYSGLPGFSYPFLLGVLSLALSFGKGVVFYAPGLLVGPGSRLDRYPEILAAQRLWLVFLGGLVAVYARWWSWYGGEFWGPRFLLFASIPASLLLALRIEERGSVGRSLVTLGALILSVWIGADGALFGQDSLSICHDNGYALEHLCWHVPEYAAWISPFVEHRPLGLRDACFLAYYVCVLAYLAAPIVAHLVRTARPGLGRALQAMSPRGWRW
jgi:hypothetical protein